MKVLFLEQFEKDLAKIRDKSILTTVARLIPRLEQANAISDIPGLKKLSGFKNVYRLRIHDHRIGLIIERQTIELARILHRKDIYQRFP